MLEVAPVLGALHHHPWTLRAWPRLPTLPCECHSGFFLFIVACWTTGSVFFGKPSDPACCPSSVPNKCCLMGGRDCFGDRRLFERGGGCVPWLLWPPSFISFWKLFLPMCEDRRCHGPVTNTHSACKNQALGSPARPHIRVQRRPREGEGKAAEPGKVTPYSVN